MTGDVINSRNRVDFFDYLRAFAVTLVVMAHYIGSIVPGGSIGVSVFFCLSGFLIMTILLKEHEITFGSAARFIVRRFMRVFPAYLGAILFMIGLMKITHSVRLPELLAALPGLLTFTKMPDSIGMETGVFWTLHVEFWFYVTMPIFVMLFGRGQALMTAVICLIALSLVAKLSPFINVRPPNLGPFSTLIFWMDNLLYGSIVAILAYWGSLTIPKFLIPSLICVALLLLVGIAAFISSEDRLFAWPFEATAASVVTAVTIAAFVCAKAGSVRVFSHAWVGAIVAWIGQISYSIYLYHAIPLDYHAALPKIAIFFLPFLIVAVAAASFYLVEQPGIKLGRKLASLGRA